MSIKNTIDHNFVGLPVFRMLSAIHLSHFSPSSSSLRIDLELPPALIIPLANCKVSACRVKVQQDVLSHSNKPLPWPKSNIQR